MSSLTRDATRRGAVRCGAVRRGTARHSTARRGVPCTDWNDKLASNVVNDDVQAASIMMRRRLAYTSCQ